jgi:uncharacterized protein (DUF2141 family)
VNYLYRTGINNSCLTALPAMADTTVTVEVRGVTHGDGTMVLTVFKGKFGPPKYKDAKVVVGDEPVTVPVNLVEIDNPQPA